jgi:CHAD domain-containing protein
VARPRPIPDLKAEATYASAAAKAVGVRSEELFEHSHDVLDTDDIERVHDMRVATRRLRATLEIFEPCLPKRELDKAEAEVKALADALGERRDRDVAIAALDRFAHHASDEDRAGVMRLIYRLRGEQREANEALAKLVTEKRLGEVEEKLSALVTATTAESP